MGAAPGVHGAGGGRTRTGFFARVRVGGLRRRQDPSARARTCTGPKEDRLRLTRATKTNLSPIFSLFPDVSGSAGEALDRAVEEEPFSRAHDHEGTLNTLWRVAEPDSVAALQGALADAELLIADGHHRYETARVYADEIGGEGDHRYVLMLLCSLSDPGLLVFPTHRLLTGLKDDTAKQLAIRDAAGRDFHVEPLESPQELEPPGNGRVAFGYMDSFHKQPYRLTLKDQTIAERALEGMPAPYRRLDTAVLEALILRDALGMSEDDIAHLRGLEYSKSLDDAIERVSPAPPTRASSCATPVEQVREVAEAGGRCPPSRPTSTPRSQPASCSIRWREDLYAQGDDGTTGLWYGGRVAKHAGARGLRLGRRGGLGTGAARAAAERGGSSTATSCAFRTSCSHGAERWPPRPGRGAARARGVEGHGRDGRAARGGHRPLHGPGRPAAQVRAPGRHGALGAARRGPRGGQARRAPGHAAEGGGELADDTVLGT